MESNEGYFDIDIDVDSILSSAYNADEIFYVKDLKQRKLFINNDIEQETIFNACKMIMQYNAEDKGIEPENRKPILLYVVSNGGSVYDGFQLIDTIRISKTPVYTINMGYLFSMGFLIGIAGHKRFAFPNAKFLHHDGSNMVYDSTSKVKDRMEFNDRMESRTRQYVISNTKITPEQYDENLRKEWYMMADEAKELGVIDYIVGVDCSIDEVV